MSAEVVWAGWLVLFLVYEVVAAIAKPKGDTLSENVWRWFDTPFRKAVLAVFMLTLTSHFVFAWPGGSGVIITGIPVGIVIGRGLARGRR